jgi:hypothetical protein
MKKLIIALFGVQFLFAGNLFCQQMEIGFLGGSGLSTGADKPASFSRPAFGGFCAGLMLQQTIKPYLAIQENILYDKRIHLNPIPLTDATGVFVGNFFQKLRFEYISVPVFASWRLGNKNQFIINSGTYFSYLFRESSNISALYTVKNKTIIEIDNDTWLDAGMLLGLGFRSDLSERMSFYFEFRNCIGMMNVSPTFWTEKAYLNQHTLLVGFSFRTGKKTSQNPT